LNVGITTKLIAAAFALCGFTVAVVAGLAAGNSAQRVLTTALVSMILCQITGLLVGVVGERTVIEYVQTYKRAHPIPGVPRTPAEDSPQSIQND
jgi:putative Mn2+ efflux pump MntP